MASKVIDNVEEGLDILTIESLHFLRKAFLGQVPMDEPQNRVLASSASSLVGAWTRLQATKSQQEQTKLVRSAIFARDLGGKQTDYLDSVPRALGTGDAPAD